MGIPFDSIRSENALDQSQASLGSCDTARRALVTIHTESLFDKLAGWYAEIFPQTVLTAEIDKSIPPS